MSEKIILATRKSPLALAQTELVKQHLGAQLPDAVFETLKVVTTGDKKKTWSLEHQGGKGLFTKELETALVEGEASLAVHSAKDLPTEFQPGLEIAGYLPRERANDVMVAREDCGSPGFIATGSPRRRAQARILFPHAVWSEIRGNIDTRLNKITGGQADATILASAGLKRLGIDSWPGAVFKPFTIEQMVPAVGQGAVAIQCRSADKNRFSALFDAATNRAVSVERLFLSLLGGGCHSAYAAHVRADDLFIFHEACGIREFSLSGIDPGSMEEFLRETIVELKLS